MQVGTKVTKKHIMLVEVDLQVSIYLSDDGRYLHFWRPKYCNYQVMIHLSCFLHPRCRISDINTSVLARKVVLSIYSYSIYIIHNVFRTWAIRLVNLIWWKLGATKTSRISRLCLNPFNRKTNPTYLISVISSSLPSILNPVKLSPSFPTRLL